MTNTADPAILPTWPPTSKRTRADLPTLPILEGSLDDDIGSLVASPSEEKTVPIAIVDGSAQRAVPAKRSALRWIVSSVVGLVVLGFAVPAAFVGGMGVAFVFLSLL